MKNKVFYLNVFTNTGKPKPDSQTELDELLHKGWIVKTVTPQYLSTGTSRTDHGSFLIILEKY